MPDLSPADLERLEQTVTSAVQSGKLTSSSAENLRPWLTQPYYAEYRLKLSELIRAGQFAELNRLFWEKIPFGTGGRRGPMAELGSATINRRTIAESAYGLGVYVKQAVGEKPWKAVVACDTRNRSQEFAQVSASVLAALGFHVYCFPRPRATPELSFAVRHLGCDTGIMISASHNPPADNGFKAYWSTGGQVLSPHDKGIITCVEAAGEIPQLDFAQGVKTGAIEIIGEAVDQAYVDAVAGLSLSASRGISAMFTPLHGVGETSVFRVLQQAGFSGVKKFELQCAQDGNFPNVPDHLPNPERPQVFEPAIQAAHGTDVALVLASDPDADRLAVAVKDHNGEFRTLTGNALGALLTDYILAKRKAAGTLSPDHFVVETLVTTPMISAIAHSYGVRAISDLLVGFKYIGLTIDREGQDRFVFGVEESLGYLSGTYARDKDAAIAGLYALELAAELQAQGRTLLDRLDELYETHGIFLEDQLSLTRTGPEGNQEIVRMMTAFRQEPPEKLGDLTLRLVKDFREHEIRAIPGNRHQAKLPSPSGDLLIAEGEGPGFEAKIAVRPSGTEPKIKFYLFVHGTDSGGTESRGGAGRLRNRDKLHAALRRLKGLLNEWADAVCRGG